MKKRWRRMSEALVREADVYKRKNTKMKKKRRGISIIIQKNMRRIPIDIRTRNRRKKVKKKIIEKDIYSY